MDDAVAGGVDVALATAAAAARFGCAERRRSSAAYGARDAVAGGACTRRRSSAAPGGVPLWSTAGSSAASASAASTPPSARTSRPRSPPHDRRPASSASPSSAAAPSAACTPPTSPACPASRCGPSTRGPSTSRRSRRDGLRVTGHADFVAPVHAVTDAADLPACDFGIVATKALHTRAAVEAARGRRSPDAAVVSVQNGIGNEEVIAEVVPRVMRGSIVTAGHVDRAGRGPVRRARRLVVRPVRAEPGPAPTRSPRWPGCSPTGGLRTHRAGRRPRPAVDQGRLQRRDQPARGADRAHGRARSARDPGCGARSTG